MAQDKRREQGDRKSGGQPQFVANLRTAIEPTERGSKKPFTERTGRIVEARRQRENDLYERQDS